MIKELSIHFLTTLLFFLIISLIQGLFSLSYWPFWVGGLLGTILPDVDHLLYVYFLKPSELTSQRVNHLASQGSFRSALELLYATRSERKGLIFHTIFFQLLFFVLTFFVLTSTGGLLSRGVALAFFLHLYTDQIIDWRQLGSIDNWQNNLQLSLNSDRQKAYIAAGGLAVLFFALLF